MLSREENELLTRTGPGTAMGEAMRRYWIPALLAREIGQEARLGRLCLGKFGIGAIPLCHDAFLGRRRPIANAARCE